MSGDGHIVSPGEGPDGVEGLRTGLRAALEGLGVEADVTISEDEEDTLVAVVEGPGAQRLIEDGGEVLDALQHLGGRLLGPSSDGRRRRVVVDAAGYRDRRAEALRGLAALAAEEALEHGEEIELDAMTPQDRRIVHMALQDRLDIVTRSEGEEPRRRIIVEPAE